MTQDKSLMLSEEEFERYQEVQAAVEKGSRPMDDLKGEWYLATKKLIKALKKQNKALIECRLQAAAIGDYYRRMMRPADTVHGLAGGIKKIVAAAILPKTKEAR